MNDRIQMLEIEKELVEIDVELLKIALHEQKNMPLLAIIGIRVKQWREKCGTLYLDFCYGR